MRRGADPRPKPRSVRWSLTAVSAAGLRAVRLLRVFGPVVSLSEWTNRDCIRSVGGFALWEHLEFAMKACAFVGSALTVQPRYSRC